MTSFFGVFATNVECGCNLMTNQDQTRDHIKLPPNKKHKVYKLMERQREILDCKWSISSQVEKWKLSPKYGRNFSF